MVDEIKIRYMLLKYLDAFKDVYRIITICDGEVWVSTDEPELEGDDIVFDTDMAQAMNITNALNKEDANMFREFIDDYDGEDSIILTQGRFVCPKLYESKHTIGKVWQFSNKDERREPVIATLVEITPTESRPYITATGAYDTIEEVSEEKMLNSLGKFNK
jgi:hypothetical protein